MNSLKRKIRKLTRDPEGFFKDFVTNRRRQMARVSRGKPSAAPGSVKGARQYSVVSAVYNVERYLDAYFRSLTRQSLDFAACIELVLVDDGSTDRSAQIIRTWQRKFPNNIRYIRKENGGQASARNLGLDYARGRWITFIDPDDFVSSDYFEHVERSIAGNKTAPALISCNFIFYFDRDKRVSNTHPLKYRFAKGTNAVDFSKPTGHMQLATTTVFFDAGVIEHNGLRFSEAIRPNFEDAHFVNRYLLYTGARVAVFLAEAHYFYRKRDDGTSTLDTSWEKEGVFTDVLEHGVLSMMRAWKERTGAVPVFVQRTALYHLMWYFRRLIDREERLAFLGDDARRRFAALVREIFADIDVLTIEKFDLAGIWFLHRVGLLATYKQTEPSYQIVYLDAVDFNRKLFKLRYFSARKQFESFRFDGAPVDPVFTTSRTYTFADERFVEEHIVWLPLRRHAELKVQLECNDVRLSLAGKQHKSLRMADVCVHFENLKAKPPKSETRLSKAICRLASTSFVKAKYAGAWALMDRDTQADDNAEHLYRYLREDQAHVPAYFLLNRKSPDWDRLKREGFRLVRFGGLRHKLLMLNAAHFVSSNIDRYIVEGVESARYGHRLSYRFTFLQHGVTKDDLSQWLNTKDIDCFVTSAPREYASIANENTRYKFSARETALTGMPRHDRLLKSADPEKIILIMPTWRASLVGAAQAGGSSRDFNEAFSASEYFQQWNGLLGQSSLPALAKQYGYRIVFHPHPAVMQYRDQFDLADNVTVATQAEGSIQNLFAQTALLITDYSSVGFDAAFMHRPLVYFQFDHDEFFSSMHAYRKGYFDYEADGFGPVCHDRAQVLDAVEVLLKRGARMSPLYRQRVDTFMPLRDGKNSERTFMAIAALDTPALPAPVTRDCAVESLDQALRAQKWPVVIERARRLAALDDCGREEQVRAALACSLAYRRQKKADAARAELEHAQLSPADGPDAVVELAEVATMLGDWASASAYWRDALTQIGRTGDESEWHATRQLLHALHRNGDSGAAIAVALTMIGTPAAIDVRDDYATLAGDACAMADWTSARSLALCVLDSREAKASAKATAKGYSALARCYEHESDWLKALSMWMQACRAHPEDAGHAAAFGALNDRIESWNVEQWRAALESSALLQDTIGVTHAAESSSDIDVALVLATFHRKQDDFEAAFQTLAGPRRANGADTFVRLAAGELALVKRDWNDARTQLAAVRSGVAGSARLRRGLLIARAELKEAKQEAFAASVFASLPDDAATARAFALIHARAKRWNDALCGWEAVITRLPASDHAPLAEASAGLVDALRALGRIEDARAIVEMRLVDAPRDPEWLRLNAALAAERLDWRAAARAWSVLEADATTSEEHRLASRTHTLALWRAGAVEQARARLWHEAETTAFDALSDGDALLAARRMSWVSRERSQNGRASPDDDSIFDDALRAAGPHTRADQPT